MVSGQDYSSVGGSLRLKGSGGITKNINNKKKKKKKPNHEHQENSIDSNIGAASKDANYGSRPQSHEPDDHEPSRDANTSDTESLGADSEPMNSGANSKTQSQLKFDEARRKRLDQKLLKDPRSHKERVDAFNKYLANLSEHHDMPRIGPG